MRKRQGEPLQATGLSDEQLVNEAIQGDERAFEDLVRRYEDRLRQFFELRGSDRQVAEDCLQETLWEVHQNLAKFDPAWRFSTWLFAIARRVSFRVNKDEVAKWAKSDLPVKINSPYAVCQVTAGSEKLRRLGERSQGKSKGPEDAISEAEGNDDLWDWVRSHVNHEEFRVLWLSYVEDLSLSDLAVVLNRSYGGAKSLLFRARRKLRQCMRKTL